MAAVVGNHHLWLWEVEDIVAPLEATQQLRDLGIRACLTETLANRAYQRQLFQSQMEVLTQAMISLLSFSTVSIPPFISLAFCPSLLVSVALFAALKVLSREPHIADKETSKSTMYVLFGLVVLTRK